MCRLFVLYLIIIVSFNMIFTKDFHIQCRKVGTQNITTFLRFRANTKYKAVVIDDVKCV